MRSVCMVYIAISAETTLSDHVSKWSGFKSYSSPAQAVADAVIRAMLCPSAVVDAGAVSTAKPSPVSIFAASESAASRRALSCQQARVIANP